MKQKIYNLQTDEKQKVLERLAGAIAKQSDIVFAYVYGSFTEDAPFHDIDIGVYVSTIGQETGLPYALELARELEDELHFPVDVRVLNNAPVSFLHHVFHGRIIFERDEETRSAIVERTIRKYLDIKPFITRGIKEAFAA